VIVFTPTVVEASEHVPAEIFAVHCPPVPSVTVTVPVGVPAPGAVTATDQLTAYACPITVGVDVKLAAFVIVVVVSALLT
jgi:hypothetical protein